jgi:hypothetical protein
MVAIGTLASLPVLHDSIGIDTIVPSTAPRPDAVLSVVAEMRVTMNTGADTLLDRGQAIAAPAAVLRQWYASHSIVRRLWAIDASDAIRIVMTLEPTLDGDDTQPAWLANSWTWAQELRFRLQRHVHLELINEPSARVEASCDSTSALITEISWRDPSSGAD